MSVAACSGCAAVGAPQSKPLRREPTETRVLRLSVPDLHCAGCIAAVERAVAAVPGVAAARVNLSQKRVTAEVGAGVDEETLIEALAKAGRTAKALNADLLGTEEDATGRSLLAGIAVSGFAMMNVMLLSVSVWSGAEEATREFLHWISAAIALPAVAFSARPFFRAALQAARSWKLNMDVPIAVAIALAAAMSLYETAYGGRHAYFDAALSLTFFLLLGRYLDHRTRAAARSAARELSALESAEAVRLIGEVEERVSVDDLEIGDLIRVAPGMRAPVDGVVETGVADLDRSHLTGETVPKAVATGDAVESGALVLTAPVVLRATAVGADTSLRRMAEMVEAAEAGRAKYASLADQAAKIYAPLVHLLALVAFLGWVWASGDARLSLNIAVAVLIITCPCALGLAAPAVATAAAGSLFRRGVLLKNGAALEKLAEVDTVVFDKTGTLTTGAPRLAEAPGDDALALAAALASQSAHPFAKAVADAARDKRLERPRVENARELPGKGVEAEMDSVAVRFGSAAWIGAEENEGAAVWLRVGDEAPVRFGFAETARDGAADLIAALKARGLAVKLMSGDGPVAVSRLAFEVGIEDAASGLSPADKIERVAALSLASRRVLMVGDGLNDAGALAAAHVSIAPASGLDAARVASDVVLLNDDLRQIDVAMDFAKSARKRIIENFCTAGLYNLVAVPIALAGFATPFIAALAMSASSITVSLNAARLTK
ncbi:MAG: heavy metal translocating P-type ATPase [Pseudomonadota bacterium]